MLDSRSLIDCKFKPGPDAPMISVQLTLIDYEIMCKQTVDENFCQCETNTLYDATNDVTTENTLDEFFVTKTITEKVYLEDDGRLDFKKGSNQVAFILGIALTIFVMSIAALTIYLVIKRRQTSKTVELARSLSSRNHQDHE